MVHYRVHKSPPLDPTLYQMNRVHMFPPYLTQGPLQYYTPI